MKTEQDLERLRDLYEDIHACAKCVKVGAGTMGDDGQKVARVVNVKALDSEIFLIGQALGETTQRKSGIPYTTTDGPLSQSGKNLNKFLTMFGCTVDSNSLSDNLKYVYSSDLVQCYPGKAQSGGDRKPYAAEVHLCLEQQYLLNEIELVKPKLILLMGKMARDSIYTYVLKKPYPESLTAHMSQILKGGHMDTLEMEETWCHVLPIQHPSGANPRFSAMIENDTLNRLIREVLK